MIGRVIKGIGGFYFVHDGEKAVMGKARGNLKRNKELIYVGDIVDFEIDEHDSDNECVINRVIERRNFMTRPPVSNLDMLVVVFSVKEPDVNYPVIDKLLAGCELKGITPAVCITKKDLVSEEELEAAMAVYRDIYPVISVNGNTGEGLEDLKTIIRGRNVALAGPSGVGKSTLTNLLHSAAEDPDTGEPALNGLPGAAAGTQGRSGSFATIRTQVETGSISDKTGRGRHTTRHVEIFESKGGGLIYDTPGFTSFDILEAEEDELQDYYPDIAIFKGKCFYDNCRHLKEPDCAVKAAVKVGKISRIRYRSYKTNMEEIKEKRKY